MLGVAILPSVPELALADARARAPRACRRAAPARRALLHRDRDLRPQRRAARAPRARADAADDPPRRSRPCACVLIALRGTRGSRPAARPARGRAARRRSSPRRRSSAGAARRSSTRRDARVDTHRALRHGPARGGVRPGKTAEQIAEIAARAARARAAACWSRASTPRPRRRCCGAVRAASTTRSRGCSGSAPPRCATAGKGTIAVVCGGHRRSAGGARGGGVARRFGNKVELLARRRRRGPAPPARRDARRCARRAC